MNKTNKSNPGIQPDRFTPFLHLILLFGCCVIVAIRVHINEAFPTNWHFNNTANSPNLSSGETPAMLILAGLIITFTLLWFLNQCRVKILTWEKTVLVCPWILLLIAGVISTVAASNKHTAIVGVINFTTPMLLALLLIQLLESRWKIHLLLAVLTATGVSLAYRCWEQKTYDAPETVTSIMKNFDTAMARQGIEPGTYAAQQFKDRLLSEDIGGFFAISNTAASYFILTLFATLALLADKIKHAEKSQRSFYYLIGSLLVATQLCGLLITKSKGGIAAFFAALLFAMLLYAARNFFRKHVKASFIIALLLILLGTAALIGHGFYHHRLPSTSLWIRWQYWAASFSMISDHLWTGVGAENFGQYYPRYMNPAAPEVIKDPHNFWIAMLSQWGLLGLIAVVWAVLTFSLKIITPVQKVDLPNREEKPTVIKTIAGGLIIVTTILIARFLTSSHLDSLSVPEKESVYLITFFVPATIWLIVFLLVTVNEKKETTKKTTPANTREIILLSSALLGFLLHNSIDFAIFHPAVTTGFFALAAVCLAWQQIHHDDHIIHKKFSPTSRWITSIFAVAFVALFWTCTRFQCNAHQSLKYAQNHSLHAKRYLPVSRASIRMDPEQVIPMLESARKGAKRASNLNSYDPEGCELQAKISFRIWQNDSSINPTMLLNAISLFKQAAQRDPQNYRYYHQTARLYRILAKQYPPQKAAINQALAAAHQAFLRNPVKPEVMLNYADLLNKTGKPDLARQIYRRILDDDRAFEQQQKQMTPFPQTTPTPRLHPTLKQKVQQALEKLSRDSALIP